MLRVPGSPRDIAPTWMTEALQDRFPGVVVSEARLTDVVSGTNRRARVLLTYAAGDGPERVFVKMQGRLANRLALFALGAVTAEARLFASSVTLAAEHAVAYAAGFSPRRLASFVVLEDVTLRDGSPNDATRPLRVAQARSGLRELARLHAAHWQRTLPPDLAFVRPWRFRRLLAPVSATSLANALLRLRAREVRGRGASRADGRDGLGMRLRGLSVRDLDRRFRASAALAATGPQTLLHGDPHPGNTYALPGERIGFYDWQLIRSGNWAHDVGYFLVSSLDVSTRRAHERELLTGYLDALSDLGVAAPSAHEAWERYRATPAYGLGAWLHTFSGGTFQREAVCMAALERFAHAYADLGTATLAG